MFVSPNATMGRYTRSCKGSRSATLGRARPARSSGSAAARRRLLENPRKGDPNEIPDRHRCQKSQQGVVPPQIVVSLEHRDHRRAAEDQAGDGHAKPGPEAGPPLGGVGDVLDALPCRAKIDTGGALALGKMRAEQSGHVEPMV